MLTSAAARIPDTRLSSILVLDSQATLCSDFLRRQKKRGGGGEGGEGGEEDDSGGGEGGEEHDGAGGWRGAQQVQKKNLI